MRTTIHATLATRQAGDGDALVLVPGLAGLARFWDPVAAAMSHRYRVIAVDHPGMGASPATAEHSVANIVTGVMSLLDELSIQRCTVVGHSTGGLVAQALALDFPERVDKLVLSSTWAKPDRRFRDLFRLRQFVLQHGGKDAYALLGQLLAYPANWYEENLAVDAEPALHNAPATEAAATLRRIDMLLGYERSAELDRVKTPTLVVGAPDDNIIPFHHSEELARRIRGARLVELAGGHFAPTTRTADYVAVLQRFLGEPQ